MNKLAGAWTWFIGGLTEAPTTVDMGSGYLEKVVWFRWGLAIVFIIYAVLTGSNVGTGWLIVAISLQAANNVAHTVHTVIVGRRGSVIRPFWRLAPFIDLVVISLIITTLSNVIFLAWAVAIMPMYFYPVSLSWKGSYQIVLALATAAAYAAIVAVHIEGGLSIRAADIAVVSLLLATNSWVTMQTAFEQRRLTGQLEAQSLTDSLTGLANRRALTRGIATPLMTTMAGTEWVAVFVIDLDDFKQVNDSFGHTAGDDRLCGVADVFRRSLRREDLVYRYGGDEFVVLAPVSGDEEAASMAERLRAAVRAEVGIDFSVGYVLVPTRGPDLGKALQVADHALLEAKRRGKGCVVPAAEPGAALSTA